MPECRLAAHDREHARGCEREIHSALGRDLRGNRQEARGRREDQAEPRPEEAERRSSAQPPDGGAEQTQHRRGRQQDGGRCGGDRPVVVVDDQRMRPQRELQVVEDDAALGGRVVPRPEALGAERHRARAGAREEQPEENQP